MTGLYTRELVRDRRYFYFAFFFPFGMLSIFLVIGTLLPKSASAPDFMQLAFPMSVFLAVTGSALTVTSSSLAGMRQNGTLRLLGTTPVGRSRLIVAHMIPRVGMLCTQVVLLMIAGMVVGAIDVVRVPAMIGSSLMGLLFFLSMGYVIGGRISSPDAASGLASLVQMGTLFLSGLMFPLWLMPHTVATVLSWMPPSFFADLMMHQMSGTTTYHSIPLSCLVLVACRVNPSGVRVARRRGL